MSRRLLVTAVALIVSSIAGTVQAGLQTPFFPAESTLTIRIGALSEVAISGTGGSVSLENSKDVGHHLTDSSGIWQSKDFGPGTSILTTTPMITKLVQVSGSVFNQAGSFWSTTAPKGGGNPVGPGFLGGEFGFRGFEPLSGNAILHIMTEKGYQTYAMPFSVVGDGTATTTLDKSFTVTGASFVTGKVKITGITTKLVSIPTRQVTGVVFTLVPTPDEMVIPITINGAAANGKGTAVTTQVTISGSNNLGSAARGGRVTLISPIRINTGTNAGSIPGVVTKEFAIPEPGSLLLFVSAAASLVVIGRIRGRKNRGR